jgi:hypothetical protein
MNDLPNKPNVALWSMSASFTIQPQKPITQRTSAPQQKPWWARPMNSQSARCALARQIIKDCKIARIIETGTFFGTTTEFFAAFGLPVVTVELNPAHAAQSRERLKTLKNVRLLEMDSISACRNWSMIAAIVLYRLCFISMHTGKSIFLCAPRPNLQFQIFHKQF